MTGLAGPRTPGSSRGPGRRAFSLIEVMVVIAVLVLLTAVVMPTLTGASESVEFKETCEQLSSAVSVCRSEAQRRGTPMELVTRKESDGRTALVGRPASFEERAVNAEPRRGQVLLVLPFGYTIDHDSGLLGPPEALHGPEPTTSDDETDDPAPVQANTSEDDGAPKPLVVFWASGGASAGPGLFLHGRGGRVVGAEINSFTGLMKLEQVADASEDKPPQDGKPNPGKHDAPLSVESDGP